MTLSRPRSTEDAPRSARLGRLTAPRVARWPALRDVDARGRRYALVLVANRAQARFLVDGELAPALGELLGSVLEITSSELGLIGEVRRDGSGEPRLTAHALRDASPRAGARARVDANGDLELPGDPELLGALIRTGSPVIRNPPRVEPRQGGEASARPGLGSFLGLPLRVRGEIAGVLGVADRPGGYDDALVSDLAPILDACAVLVEAHRSNRARTPVEAEVDALRAALEERTAALTLATQELEAFRRAIAHDLRAPLRNILGFVDLLVRARPAGEAPDARRYVETIAGEARRLGALIDDLLALARVGRTPLHLQTVDVGQLVAEVRAGLEAETHGRDIVWKVATLPDVRADRSLLRQVLANLIGNALKYTRRRDRAEIEIGSLPSAEGQQVFFVRDNGVGFDMVYAGKLFGVFQRLHSAKEFEGAGVGLVNVLRIIQRHRGTVRAEAAVDQGATFFFSLPARTE